MSNPTSSYGSCYIPSPSIYKHLFSQPSSLQNQRERKKERVGSVESRKVYRPTHQNIVMASTKWVKTITSPFKKAKTFFNQPQQQQQSREKKSQQEQENQVVDHLHGEVMACAYEDVQVMWSILDKSKPRTCNNPITTS